MPGQDQHDNRPKTPYGPPRLIPVAREGWPIVAVFALLTLLIGWGSVWLLGWAGYAVFLVGVVLTLWSIWFFRDFERASPDSPGVVLSPADGVVVSIGPASPPEELGLDPADTAGMTRISVFMNVFNVHVNRIPADSTVSAIHYRPGTFVNASLDKASIHNERLSVALDLPDGRKMVVVQIAGLIARRIVCRVEPGQRVGAGERFGLIRFGSRVDLYLPAGVEPLARLKQRSVAGVTVFASLGGPAAPAPAAAAQGLRAGEGA